MTKLDRTFSAEDLVRIYCHHLTDVERAIISEEYGVTFDCDEKGPPEVSESALLDSLDETIDRLRGLVLKPLEIVVELLVAVISGVKTMFLGVSEAIDTVAETAERFNLFGILDPVLDFLASVADRVDSLITVLDGIEDIIVLGLEDLETALDDLTDIRRLINAQIAAHT